MDRMPTTPTPPDDRATRAADPRFNRSRLTNGALLPRGVDGRSAEARRWLDLYRDIAGRVTLDPVSPLVATRIRACVSLTMVLEEMSARQARGEPVDAAELVAISNAHARVLRELGVMTKRRK